MNNHAKQVLDLPIPADFNAHQRSWMAALDRQASRIGERMRATHPAPAQLRARADGYEAQGLSWLAAKNRDLADALERDARLAAVEIMWAAAVGDGGLRRFFLNDYRRLLTKHVARRSAALQPEA